LSNKSSSCGNCDYQFSGSENYCPKCGQDNHIPNVPIGHLFLEFLESIFHFDTKIWKSLQYLIFYPGRMTKDFLENKRARFVPPVRLYIFISVIYFLLLNVFHIGTISINKKSTSDFQIGFNSNKNEKTTAEEIDSLMDAIIVEDSLKADHLLTAKDSFSYLNMKFRIHDLVTFTKDKHTSPEALLRKYNYPVTFFNKIILKQTAKAFTSKSQYIQDVFDFISKKASMAMFFILPLFALIVNLLFFRQKRNYYEHLIFSIHYHSAIFLFLSLFILYYKLSGEAGVILVAIVLGILYFYKSLRTIYNQSKVKTMIKTILFFFSYFLVLSFALIALFILGLLFS
jgi:hypothetical protein